MLQIHDMRAEELRKSFANSLRNTRLELQCTAKDLAVLLGLYPSRFSDYELGKKVPTRTNFNKIIKGFKELGVDEYDLEKLEKSYETTLRYSNNKTVGKVNYNNFKDPEPYDGDDDDDDSIALPEEVVKIIDTNGDVTKILDDIPEN